MQASARPTYRAIFMSDLHLGTRACRVDDILDFLRDYDAETIYLVGDVVDFWRIKHNSYWPQKHNDVIQKLLRKVRKGTRIVFIPGNHDEALRDYCGAQFGGIIVLGEAVHESADGRQLLVVHGDDFDGIVHYTKWISFLGDRSYVLTLWTNTAVNRLRRRLDLGYWSLSKFVKSRIKHAIQFIDRFETALAHEASRRGYDGVICGHIHHAADKTVNGVAYLNCGDWVESCTALVEDYDGRFRLVRWHEEARRNAGVPTPAMELPAAA
jgi:UDP-2,3-diacylglucosamine pyrophosphatase LpxH